METVNPLLVVEHRLGAIEIWPSYIIRYLFLNCPRSLIIEKMTAFFYGNGITLSLAIRLYQICNDKYASPVANTMSNLYLKWQRNIFKPHMFHFYDIQHQQFLWINGSYLNQTETVEPEVIVMDFGIDGCYSQRASEIRNKVWKLRVERSEVKWQSWCLDSLFVMFNALPW